MMTDDVAFLQLSKLLTGLTDDTFHVGSEDVLFNTPTATEYARRLRGTFGAKFQALLDAYKSVADVTPAPAIADPLLAALRATQAFTDNEVVAKQIVNIWYFSQFNSEDGKSTFDGGFYERGAVWPVVGAHPIGFSTLPHGYWTQKP